jgi:fatty acid desaturase
MVKSANGEMPIPATLNVVVLAVAISTASACLYWASHASSVWVMWLAAIAFSFANNTLFSLLHEAVHGLFHPKASVNRWAGRIAAAFYPTSFCIQRAFHLNHHKNNRSDLEQFDYIRETDSRFLKYAQWYSILTGIYWLFSPVFCILYSFSPGLFRIPQLRDENRIIGHQTSASPYLNCLAPLSLTTIRYEVLLSILIQVLLFRTLDLSLTGWLCCYACFAVNWSSLQYADHAFSPLDRRNGAWNLKVNPFVKAIFLNYHDHLSHHRSPDVPWPYLPRLKVASHRQPSFLRIYREMWKGPRRIEQAQSMTELLTRD